MSAATVRISPKGHRILSQLVAESNASMPEVLDQALEAFRRQRFLEQAAAAYEAQSTEDAVAYRTELASLEGVLGDGLDKSAP